MDPKKQTDLNPKLKEIYERVMATKVSPQPTPPATPPQPQASATSPTAPAAQAPTPPGQSPPGSATQPAHNTSPAKIVGATPVAKPAVKGHNNGSLILLIITGVIFFTAYTLFWFRFFNVALPFTLPF